MEGAAARGDLMPFGFLRPPRRQGPLSVRRTGPGDLAVIHRLLRDARQVHIGPEGVLPEEVERDFVLGTWQGTDLVGLVTAYRQGPQAAWLDAFALADDAPAKEIAQALLRRLEEEAARAGITWLGYMDAYDRPWLRGHLRRAGFSQQTRVVSYETPMHPPPTWGNPAVQVRPATPTDIPAVGRVDRAAFAPLWAYRDEILHACLKQPGFFLLAEEAGEVVGYILIVRYDPDHAHVVRLAVHPQHQGRQIGARLLAEGFSRLSLGRQGWVSLNTQEENVRSQRLYRRFGFRPTGKGIPVWAKGI